MRKLIGEMRARLPRRRRRFWRYISPRRQGLGLVMLALLTAAIYGYWYMTNDGRIRRQAKWYLRRLTGAHVTVDRAQFSLFGNIELQGVNVFVPFSGASYPLLKAKSVILRHRPWSLLLHRRVQPTEITFIEPSVFIEHYVSDDTYNYQKLLSRANLGQAGQGAWHVSKLPRIRVRRCSVLPVEVIGELLVPGRPTQWDMSMVPRPPANYRITIEQTHEKRQEPIRASFDLNVPSGNFRALSGSAPILTLASALPQKYGKWRERFDVKGVLRLKAPAKPPKANEPLEFELVGASMKLPPAQGGLQLEDVRGGLVFDEKGMTFRSVKGRVAQAGYARFELSGRYAGYEQNSPFEVDLRIENLTIPRQLPGDSGLAKFVGMLQRWYRPEGRMDLTAAIRREKGQKLQIEAVAEPKGMSMSYRRFPYRVHDLRGQIVMTADRAELKDLTCRQGPGRGLIRGTVGLRANRGTYDVRVTTQDVRCDQELFQAIPKSYQRAWKMVQPTGRISPAAHIRRAGADAKTVIEIDILAEGHASVTCERFPYRVDNVFGRIRVSGGSATIERFRAGRGAMRCTVEGIISGINTSRPNVDLTVATTAPMPIDDVLLAALNKRSRARLAALNASGSAQVIARLQQTQEQKLRYEIAAELHDVTIQPKVFPYRLTGGTGELQITPGHVALKSFRAFRGRVPVELVKPGSVHLKGKEPTVLLDVRTGALPLDKDLYAALPKGVQEVWRMFSPRGRAGANVSLRYNTSERPGKLTYDVVLEAKGAELTYRKFPHTLRGLTGLIVAAPGKVTVKDLACEDPERSAAISGVVHYDQNATRVQLSLAAAGIPIDEKILAAMPKGIAPLTHIIRPGGTCDVNFPSLSFTRRAAAPASGPATGPADGIVAWQAKGKVTFADAVAALGKGKKTFSGSMTGTAGREAPDKGIALDVATAIDSLFIGERRITELQAKMQKPATGNLMHIRDISAKSHGGGLAGFAQIRLTDPLRYGVSISLDRMRLEQIFPRAEAATVQVGGQLDGRIQLTGTFGQAATRRASGVIRLSKATVYEVPVMLGLLHVIYLGLPGDSAFTDGHLTYRLKGRQLIFEEIHLSGAALSIVGSGTMDVKTRKLKLIFLTGPPGSLPRIPELDSLLKGISREIMEIHVTGTLENPKMTTVSLPSLKDAIEALLRPGQIDQP